jgi:hypothetical protein
MMRESVSHPHHKLFWYALLSVGSLTILTGIAVLIALMSPETIRTAPTIALVCVLILLCVPAPVLLLERSDRKAAIRKARSIQGQPTRRDSIIHESHQSTETVLRHQRARHDRSTQRAADSSISAF